MTRARENADLPVAMTESGGQVGIGATSVDQLLHLETSTNTRQKIETTNSGLWLLQLTNTAITAEIGLKPPAMLVEERYNSGAVHRCIS